MIYQREGSPFWQYQIKYKGIKERRSTGVRVDARNSRKLAMDFHDERKAQLIGAIDHRTMLERAVTSALNTEGGLKEDKLRRFALDLYENLELILSTMDTAEEKSSLDLRRKFSRSLVVDYVKTLKIADGHKAWLEGVMDPISVDRIKGRSAVWRDFVVWMNKNHPDVEFMHEVGVQIASEYAAALWQGNISSATFGDKIIVLSNVFKETKLISGVLESPFSDLKKPSRDTFVKEAFTAEEVEAILKHADGEMRIVCLLSLYTGLRNGDCLHLKWENVDMEERVIYVEPSKTSAHHTKVAVPIRPELYEALLTLNTGNQTFLFDHNRHRYDVRRNNFTYDFNKVMKKAEIKDIRVMPEGGRGRKKSRVGFHSLRKRFISDIHAGGNAQSIAMDLAGHKSEDVHQLYISISRDQRDVAINSLPAYGKQESA
ncbi:site-specific integrase [Pontiellaceae bacterium B12227]|nr:site-specific integrase [Pontiellaceae bacterium B12227]